MKTIKLFLMIIAIAISSNMAIASGTGTRSLLVDIKPVDQDLAVVEIDNATDYRYKVNIYDSDGNVVLRDASDGVEPDYKKVYNFKELENGTYKMVVSTDKVETENNLHIENGRLVLGAENVSVDPFFHQNGDILRMAYLNNTGQNATLKIYDSLGETIFEQSLGTHFNINEAYDLSKLFIGNYRAQLNVGDKYYNYYIR